MKDESSKTMRIDIHPDFLGESLERKKRQSTRVVRMGDTSFVAMQHDDKAESEYGRLLQSIYDGVMITDSKGRIVEFNTRAADFFLSTDEELLGMKVVDLISGADDELLAAISRNLLDHKYTLIEAHCVRRDKSTFPAEIAVNRLDPESGGRLCFFVRDVSVRKRAQEALEDAVARLEEHDRARSQFVSNVSHELRAPLTSMIYAVANMLKGVVGPLPDKVRRYLEILDGDCRRLLGTVNDILDLRKIENKTLTLIRTSVPFPRLVRRSVASLMVQAEQKFLSLNVTTGGGNWFVDCDAQKMERVILNVVGNAVKFTQEGGDINVGLESVPGRPGHVMLKIEDTGVGIPPELIPRVTERYFTVGEQPSGSGLGLAISKEIIALHGGTLEIKSPVPGAKDGTGVYISLPTVAAPSVMIVDDEPGIRSVLKGQLESLGYSVVEEGDGARALERIASERPDLVILDFVLPGMDGTEVILKMKSDKNMMRIPVVGVTGAGIGGGRAEILNNFAIPVLPKPWQEADLLDRVEGGLLGAATLKSSGVMGEARVSLNRT